MALEAVQAQAGHRSIESTRVYLHLTNDWLAGEYRRAAELIDAEPPPSPRCSPHKRWPSGERAARPRAGCSRAVAGSIAAAEWAQIEAAAPQLAATMRRYLQQLATFLAPASVDAAENALRQFARWIITDAGLDAIAEMRRDDIEDYKVWLAAQPRHGRGTLTAETHRQRMRIVRAFFERIIEWDWPDAPARNPVIAGDIPKKPEPLPKFLDDPDAARLMAAARASTDPRDGSSSRCWPAPACGPVSSPTSTPTRSCRSVRPLAADPARQAPQRPLRPAAPRARRAARRLDRGQPRAHPPRTSDWSPTTAARWTGT